jgi:hypothetical protein
MLILGHFPLSVNLRFKHFLKTTFWKVALLPSSGKTIQPSLLSPLERANLNPSSFKWAQNVVFLKEF